MRDAPVVCRLLAPQEAGLLGASDQLRHRALRELKALGEVGYRRLLAPVRRPFDHQQEEAPLQRQSRLPGDLLAAPKEVAQRGSELRDGDDVVDGRAGTLHAPILSPRANLSRPGQHSGQEPGRDRLGERGHAVPARHEGLAPVPVEHSEDVAGDAIRADDGAP